MQDIKTSEREMSNRKHGRIISRFEHTCSPPSTLWRIFTKKWSRKITWCCNTYNELPQELLDPQVPHLFMQEQHTQAH